MEEAPGSILLGPHNDGDSHVGLGTRFLSLTEYSHPFCAHGPCGIHSTWLCLFLLGPFSSETVTLKTSHAAPRIGLETLRLLGGSTAEVGTAAAALARVDPRGPNVTSSLWKSISVFSIPLWRSVSVSSSSRASTLLFLVLAFLLLCGRASPFR